MNIRGVIAAVPSYHFKHLNSKQKVDIEGFDGVITVKDIQNAIQKAETLKYGDKYVRVQCTASRFTVNGISTRKVPIGDRCSQLTVDVDLYFVDKKLAYDIATVIQKAGLNLMDLFVSGFAIAKEAALIEASLNRQIISIDLEYDSTTLNQIYRGKLQNSVLFQGGLVDMVQPIMDEYGLSKEMAVELLKYGTQIDKEVFSKNPIHMWKLKNEELVLLSEEDFMKSILNRVNQWIETVVNTCSPILKTGESTVIVNGEGGEQEGFVKLLNKSLQVETRNYIPESLGGRDAALTTCLGLFYAYQDKLPIYGEMQDSVDVDEFIRQISFRKNSEEKRKEDTLTNRLKSMFMSK
nr:MULTISPECIES: cell division protein FtsA [Terrabacteria group]